MSDSCGITHTDMTRINAILRQIPDVMATSENPSSDYINRQLTDDADDDADDDECPLDLHLLPLSRSDGYEYNQIDGVFIRLTDANDIPHLLDHPVPLPPPSPILRTTRETRFPRTWVDEFADPTLDDVWATVAKQPRSKL